MDDEAVLNGRGDELIELAKRTCFGRPSLQSIGDGVN